MCNITYSGSPCSFYFPSPGIWLTFAGRMVRSHGIVTQEEMGTDVDTALQCWSDSDLSELMWYFPNETPVPFGEEDSGYDVYQRMGSNVVYLHKTVNNQAVNGIYNCRAENQTLFVGIYTGTPGTTGTCLLVYICLTLFLNHLADS